MTPIFIALIIFLFEEMTQPFEMSRLRFVVPRIIIFTCGGFHYSKVLKVYLIINYLNVHL